MAVARVATRNFWASLRTEALQGYAAPSWANNGSTKCALREDPAHKLCALPRTRQIAARVEKTITPPATLPDHRSAATVSIERELQLEEDYRMLVRTYGAEAVDRYHAHLFRR